MPDTQHPVFRSAILCGYFHFYPTTTGIVAILPGQFKHSFGVFNAALFFIT
jgi:hypothetical protein